MNDTTQVPQPIIDLILADVNAVIPNFSSLVSSYRLLVGSAEEIHRIPGVCPDVFERAVRRFDNAGTLIDILLELLCCKIGYSSLFLSLSCAPVDLFRLLVNCTDEPDTPCRTAESVVLLEALRRVLCGCNQTCLPQEPVVCPTAQQPQPTPPPTTTPATPPATPPPASPSPPPCPPPPDKCITFSGDIAEVIIVEELNEGLNDIAPDDSPKHKKPPTHTRGGNTQDEKPIISRVRTKHLKDPYK